MSNSIRRLLRNPIAWQIALVAYWVALFTGTHLPPTTPILPPEGFDKVVHALSFAVLAAVLAATWQFAAGRLTFRHFCLIWIVIAIYGALDEWTQGFAMFGRTTDFYDWLADVTGAVIGLFIFTWLRRWLRIQE